MNIRSVAKQAGVAPSTVSLVLQNRPKVSPQTRQLVLETIEQLGYVPGHPGRPIKRDNSPKSVKRTNRIALLAAGMHRSSLSSPVYAEVLHGVEAALAEQRKTMVLRYLLRGEPDSDDLLTTKVDGVLLFGQVTDPNLQGQLKRIPCVRLMGQVESAESWDHVTYDNSVIGRRAANYLISQGHRSCAFVGQPMETAPRVLAARGLDFKAFLSAAGVALSMHQEPLLSDESLAVHAIDAKKMALVLEHLLAARPQPTAVFVEADMVAQALYMALRTRGVRPGADLEVISCNNERSLLANLHPVPVTIDIHAEQVGRRAVEQLLRRIENPAAPRATVLLEPTLVEGELAGAHAERLNRPVV